MRMNLSVFLAGALLVATPALAGNVTVTNNEVVWQSTQCTAPGAPPAPVTTANRHASAEEMNKRMTAHNEYVGQVQSYMDCLSKEADADAAKVSQTITGAAQKSIDDARKNVADMGPSVQDQK